MAEAHIRDEHMPQSRDETARHGSVIEVEERLLPERRLGEMPVQLLLENERREDDLMLLTSVKISETIEGDQKRTAEALTVDSGKDPTQMDRSVAYVCGQMAKLVVKSGSNTRWLVQLTYSTLQDRLTASDSNNALKIEFDCRPQSLAYRLTRRS